MSAACGSVAPRIYRFSTRLPTVGRRAYPREFEISEKRLKLIEIYLERVNGFEPSTLCLASTNRHFLAATHQHAVMLRSPL